MPVALPPPQFDHAYAGPVIEQVMTAAEVSQYCRGDFTVACMLFPPSFIGDKCYIVLPKVGPGGVAQSYQDVLRRHEVGHCNGWTSKHEGGI